MLAIVSGCSSPEERANKEAAQVGLMIQQLPTSAPLEEIINTQDSAISSLNHIVQKYPSSSMAIKILNGESVAGINLRFLTEKNRNDKQALLLRTCRDYDSFRKDNKRVCDAVMNLSSNFDAFAMASEAMGIKFTDYTKLNRDKDIATLKPFLDRPIKEWGMPTF